MKRKTGQKLKMRRARPNNVMRQRFWLNLVMLLVLLGQNILSPMATALDNGLLNTETTVSSSAEEGVTSSNPAVETEQVDETTDTSTEGVPDEAGAADAGPETNQAVPSDPVESTSAQEAASESAETPSESPAEEEVVSINKETELTEAEELTTEELAEQQLTPMAFAARSAAMLTEADGKKIETFQIEWLTKDTVDDGQANNLFQKWDDDKEKNVRFRLSFSLSGKNDYDPGDIQIKVPRYIFETRDGQPTGTLSLAVPEAPDQSGVFQYYLEKGDTEATDDDYYIIINTRKLSAASQGYIDGTIGQLVPHTIKDRATGYFATLNASLQVATETTTIGKEAESLTAHVDTGTRISNSQKNAGGYYDTYPSNFPSQLKPANPDDYYYVVWSASVYVPGTVNQPGVITFTDTTTSHQEGGTATVLGYTINGVTHEGTNTNSVSGTLFDGFTPVVHSIHSTRHYVTVYTSYPKSEFPKVHEQDYFVNNNITFTMTGKDDAVATVLTSSDRQNIRTRVVEAGYPGRYNFWKDGNTTYQKGLLDLLDNRPVTVDYSVSGVGYSHASIKTDEVGGTSDYQITITDDKGWLDNQTDLTDQDVEFAYLNFSAPDAYKYSKLEKDVASIFYEDAVGSLRSGPVKAGEYAYQLTKDYSKFPTYTVKGKTATGNYVDMGTVSFESGKPVITTKNGATASGTVLRFPRGITNYQVVMDTNLSGLRYRFIAGMTIKPSDRVKAYVEKISGEQAEPRISVYNQANVVVSKPSNQVLYQDSERGVDYLKDFRVRVDLDKELTTYANDVPNRNIRLKYTSTANIAFSTTSLATVREAIKDGLYKEEKQTTWYDLLPEGVVPDLETVKGRPGDSVTNTRLVPNYKNTGRTLMIVDMNLTPDYKVVNPTGLGYQLMDRPTLTFDANYSWYNAKNYGVDPRNIVAYQSSNTKFGTVKGWQGEPDDPQGGRNGESKEAVGEFADAMTNLDSESDSNSFIYAQDTTNLEVDTSAVSSLVKEVAVNGNGLYGDGRAENNARTVYEGSVYDYRIGTTAAPGSTLRDIVFYDILETYVPKAVDTDYQDEQWKGTFQSIDLSELEEKGIKPVVYYSTTQNLHISETDRSQTDLSDRAIWSTTAPADKSTITAIAVDARRKTDGSEFTLQENDSISAYLRMKAPMVDDIRGGNEKEDYYDKVLENGQKESGWTGGAHAYNNVKMSSIMQSVGRTENLLVEYNYVKVGLRPYNLTVKKTWDDDRNRDRIRPDQAVVRLYANGKVTEKAATLSEENEWKYTWNDVPYTDENGRVITYSVKEDSMTGYEMKLDSVTTTDDGRTYAIRNVHEPERVSIKGTKTWLNDTSATRPDSIRVTLLRDGVPYQNKTVTPNDAGQWNYAFEDLYKYDAGREIKYTITEPDYIPGYKMSVSDYDLTNEYDPYGDLVISKEVIGLTDGNKNNQFEFTVEITDTQGQPDFASYDYETSDGRTGTVQTGGKILLKHDQTATIKRVHSEHTYKVTEAAKAGYTQTAGVMTGTIRAHQTNRVEVVNTYKATGETTVDYRKVLENKDLKAYQFIFDIYDADGTVVRSGSNLRNGNIVFGALRYSLADAGKTYRYLVKERDTGSAGYTYDKMAREFTVTVTDNGDGTLKTTVAYDTGASKTFTNTYEASGKLSLKAWKVMKYGQTLKEGAYQFELREEGSDQVVARGTNGEGGVIDFTELNFTQDDIGATYTYVATEVKGVDNTVTYDQTAVRYDVTITDNNNGTLGFTTKVVDQHTNDINNDAATPVFVNEYEPGSLKIQKNIVSGDPNQEFRFKVKLTPPAGGQVPTGTVTGVREEAITSFDPPIEDKYHITAYIFDKGALSIKRRNIEERIPGQELATFLGLPAYTRYSMRGSLGLHHSHEDDPATSPVWATKGIMIGGNGTTDLKGVVFDNIRSHGGGEVIAANYVNPTTKSLDLYITIEDVGPADFQATPARRSMKMTTGKVEKKETAKGQGLLSRVTSFLQAGVDKLDRALFPRVEAATGSIVQSGNITDTVKWELYSDGEMVISPVDGVSGVLGPRETYFLDELDRLRNEVENEGLVFEKIVVRPGVQVTGQGAVRLFNYSPAKELDLSGLDTTQATSTGGMFTRNGRLEKITFGPKFDTSNVTSMDFMFDKTPNLVELDLSHFNTSKVTSMHSMFEGMTKLEKLDISSFNTAKVSNFQTMFAGVESLQTLDLSHFDISSASNLHTVFSGMKSLRELNLSGWDTSRIYSFAGLFQGLSSLENLDVSHFDTSSARTMENMFSGMTSLTHLDLSSFNTSKVTDMSEMFKGMSRLTNLNLGNNFRTSNVREMDGMFAYLTSLTDLDLGPHFDTSSVISMGSNVDAQSRGYDGSSSDYFFDIGMFEGSSGLTNFDFIKTFNTSNVQFMGNMFKGTKVSSLDLSHFDFSKVTNTSGIFQGMTEIKSLDDIQLGSRTMSPVVAEFMFKGMTGLKELTVPTWLNTSKTATMAGMFADMPNLEKLDLGDSFDTSNVSDFGGMFANLSSLTSLDLTSKFKTPKIHRTEGMFGGMSRLESLDISMMDFSTLSYSESTYTFGDNTSLKRIVLPETFGRLYEYNNLYVPYNDQYTGYWIREDGAYGPYSGYGDYGLITQFKPVMAGTWVWQERPQEYTIAFDANTGTGSMSNQIAKVDTAFALPRPSFAKLGFSFKEWNTQADGQGTAYAPGQSVTNLTSVGQSLTLYAIWEPMDNSVNIQDGEFEITLKGGEAWTLPNLPAGTTYEVYEETPAGWVLTYQGNTAGTIKPSETAVANFINDYQPGKVSYQLGAKKLLDGVGASGYVFTLKDQATGNRLQTIRSTDGGGVLFNSITYSKAGDYVYEIAELVGDDDNITYDTHTETVTVQVRADSNGNLVATPSKANADIVFHNTTKKGSLSVTKQIIGTMKGDTPTFTIKVHLDGGKETRTLTLVEGQTQVITDLPYGTTYTIEEVDLPAGFSHVRTEGATGTISAPNAQATVYNTYKASGSVNIEATKVLDTTHDAKRELQAKEFTFELFDKGADEADPSDDVIIATASNDAFGAVAFGAVNFTEPVNKTYYIREVAGLDTTVTYDNHEEAVQILAVDNLDGTLTVTATYDADQAVFTNTVNPPDKTPDPTFGAIELSKEVVNLTDANKTKDFEVLVSIKDAKGEELTNRFAYTSDKRADGTVTDGETIKIRHDEHIRIVNLPEGAVVKVTETVPKGYTLDRASVTQGKVVKDITTALHLINNYTATGSWRPKGTKELRGGSLQAGQFTFIILKDGKEIQRVTNKATGDIAFEDIAFTYDDIGKTYTYEVVEVNDRQKGIAYDRTAYTYTVSVKDDGLGQIVAEVASYNAAEPHKNAPSAAFVNAMVTYPDTGGFGSAVWTGSGGFIMLAAIYLYYKRRKEEA